VSSCILRWQQHICIAQEQVTIATRLTTHEEEFGRSCRNVCHRPAYSEPEWNACRPCESDTTDNLLVMSAAVPLPDTGVLIGALLQYNHAQNLGDGAFRACV
jgi:hypothetical protein